MLKDFGDVFVSHAQMSGRTTVVEHRIDVAKNSPLKEAPRRVPIHQSEEMEREINKMLDLGVIRPLRITMGSSGGDGYEKGWNKKVLRRLPTSE